MSCRRRCFGGDWNFACDMTDIYSLQRYTSEREKEVRGERREVT